MGRHLRRRSKALEKAMRRRKFIQGIAVFATCPVVVRAQQGDRARRIGVLMVNAEGSVTGRSRVVALEQSLEKLGWTVGRNLRIDYRWDAIDAEKVAVGSSELLALNPDLVLVSTSRALSQLQQMTRTMPIVFVLISDPVGQGFVQSLARPGGNATGFTNAEVSVGSKLLDLLREIAPDVKRIAVMFNPDNPGPGQFMRSAQAAASTYGVEVATAPVHGSADIEAAMATLAGESGGGLILPPDGFMFAYRQLIVEQAARRRLPAIYGIRDFVVAGGLAFYGIDTVDEFRQAAVYVNRIFRGETPADLPVQAPTKYETVINLNTAKALGLTIPSGVLARADEVIE
jgi:putative ABC transport system substrate-binding protein